MKTYRVEVFWEERGTVKEGGMEDSRYHKVKRQPTKTDMTAIKGALKRELKRLGLR